MQRGDLDLTKLSLKPGAAATDRLSRRIELTPARHAQYCEMVAFLAIKVPSSKLLPPRTI